MWAGSLSDNILSINIYCFKLKIIVKNILNINGDSGIERKLKGRNYRWKT